MFAAANRPSFVVVEHVSGAVQHASMSSDGFEKSLSPHRTTTTEFASQADALQELLALLLS